MKHLLFVVSLMLLSITAQAQDALISSEVKEHIKARIDNNINVGIVVGVIDGDKVEYFSYGKTALENGTDVDENSVFEIGSISKTFTTIMVADDVLKGNMSLSDPIQKFFPETVKVPTRNGKEITLKDIATHSSALPRMPDNFNPSNPNNPYADYTIDLAYEFMNSIQLTRDIGSLYEYSNFGMGMLGHILELQYDKSYEAILVERIANVYGMNDTRVVFTDNMKAHLAKGHANGREVENWDLLALAGAGAIRSTASDMVKYLKANMSDDETPLTKAMKLTHQMAYENKDQGVQMGLGWHLDSTYGLILHSGATGGYMAISAFNPKTKKGAVVLTNATANVDRIALKLLVPSSELKMPKQPISGAIINDIDANGVESGIALYHKIKAEDADRYNFDEGELNQVGYNYLGQDKDDIALAIFKLNVNMFPKASNPYDSLGEAYLKMGDSALAKTNYAKSLELNPANDNAKTILKSLGVQQVVKDVVIPQEVLETYVGKYELAPGFIITVSRTDQQLFLQATGQPQFEVFASAQNKFYLKVVEASITFDSDDDGKIVSLTLYQNGQVMPGKKLEE